MTNTRGGGYGGGPTPGKIIATILSLALIVAAVIIVITQILPLLSKGFQARPLALPSSSIQPSESPSADPSPAPTPGESGEPTTEPTAEPSPTPGSGTAATGFYPGQDGVLHQRPLSGSGYHQGDLYACRHVGEAYLDQQRPGGGLRGRQRQGEPGSKQGSATITAALEGASAGPAWCTTVPRGAVAVQAGNASTALFPEPGGFYPDGRGILPS